MSTREKGLEREKQGGRRGKFKGILGKWKGVEIRLALFLQGVSR